MLRLILLVALYLAGAWLADRFIHAPNQVALFWPASGLAYAAVLRYGLRWCGFIAVSVLLFHLLLSPAPPAFLGFSIASNTLGALAGAAYALHSKPDSQMTVRGGLLLLRGGMVMALTSALIGVAGMRWSSMIDNAAVLPGVAKWAMGDLLGVISVSPGVLLLTAPRSKNPDVPPASDYSPLQEKLIWIFALIVTFGLIYWGGSHGSNYALGLASLPMTLLLWSAIRFQPVWTAVGTTATILFLTLMTGFGLAGFTPPDAPLDSALLLIFLSLFAVTPMVLLAAGHERRIAVRKVLRRATTDAATGLANRAGFEEALRQALDERGLTQSLAYLDLDHFTLVNDTASHAAGDALIQGVASLLKARVRSSDRVFRIGGDEFALLLECDAPEAELRCQQLLSAIESYRVGWHDHVLNSTASIGLASFRPGRSDYASLLSQVDAACFTAKELGGNRVCVSATDTETHQNTEAMRWAVRIREALDHDLFELDCQSIAALHDGSGEGEHFEVLLRMRDPTTGQRLLPGYFIPAAERFRLGTQVDRHVVELVLHWFEARPELAVGVGLCAINLTAASMVDAAFGQYLAKRVQQSAFPASKLCFEITETSAVRDLDRAQHFIDEMRALGCRFALDDFGTGFCSFNYLRSLDVDYFKIDGSFVRELDSSPLATAVIRSITDIAHVLSKHTIAEHTENDAVLATLRTLGVDYAQGYAIDRPQPIAEYFAARRGRDAA